MTKITIDRSTVELALQALEEGLDDYWRETNPSGNQAITALRAALAEPVQEPVACAWHGDEDGTYETSCKHIFQMIDGTPHENNFTHCCFCGKSLVQHQWEDGNDE